MIYRIRVEFGIMFTRGMIVDKFMTHINYPIKRISYGN